MVLEVHLSNKASIFNCSFFYVFVSGKGHNVKLPNRSSGELCKDGSALPFD